MRSLIKQDISIVFWNCSEFKIFNLNKYFIECTEKQFEKHGRLWFKTEKHYDAEANAIKSLIWRGTFLLRYYRHYEISTVEYIEQFVSRKRDIQELQSNVNPI